MKTKALNIDCMKYMAGLEDNAFELAVVDPPYGIGEAAGKNHSRGKRRNSKKYTPKDWDNEPPDLVYFLELFRVSKNQIIWGANHFGGMPPAAGWVVWDKENGKSHFSDCELAFCSIGGAVRKFTYCWAGFRQGPKRQSLEPRIHPTQKPVALYRWLLTNYAKPGDRILDTHLGSGSSRIAAEELGFEFVGCELDQEYFEAQEKRFKEWYAQGNLFRDQLENNSGDQLQLL